MPDFRPTRDQCGRLRLDLPAVINAVAASPMTRRLADERSYWRSICNQQAERLTVGLVG